MPLTIERALERYLQGDLQEGDVAVAVMERILQAPNPETLTVVFGILPESLRPVIASFIVDLDEQRVDPEEVLCLGGLGGRSTSPLEGEILLSFSRDHRRTLRSFMPKDRRSKDP